MHHFYVFFYYYFQILSPGYRLVPFLHVALSVWNITLSKLKAGAIPCLLELFTHQVTGHLAYHILALQWASGVTREAQNIATAGLGDKEKQL